MKIVSFNINGLRARPHQLAALIEKHQPDVIGLQETKVHDEQFPLAEVQAPGYHVYFHGQKAITASPCSRARSPWPCIKVLPPMKKTPSGASSGAPSPTPTVCR